MTELTKRPLLLAALAFVAGAAIVGVLWALSASGANEPAGASPSPTDWTPGRTPDPTPSASDPAASADPVAANCPTPTVTVANADELSDALADASPGDVIVLAPGRYIGEFVARPSGTKSSLITLCGSSDAVLDGDSVTGGYVFHLDGAKYWHLLGFSVTNGQKGVMADGTVGSIIEGLTVSKIGDEGIHLRNFSTDNSVIGNDISNTGLRRDKFGEGVYIGSADSNWCNVSDCKPDKSDRNRVEDNTIHGTTSEAVDIKEGTSKGVLRGNHFDGSTIVAADSWVDVKGNDWLIEGNVGRNSPLDGFQTHEIGKGGWGTRNVFRNNTAVVNGPGFGFSLTPVRGNVVACDNKVSKAGEGFSNVTCSG